MQPTQNPRRRPAQEAAQRYRTAKSSPAAPRRPRTPPPTQKGLDRSGRRRLGPSPHLRRGLAWCAAQRPAPAPQSPARKTTHWESETPSPANTPGPIRRAPRPRPPPALRASRCAPRCQCQCQCQFQRPGALRPAAQQALPAPGSRRRGAARAGCPGRATRARCGYPTRPSRRIRKRGSWLGPDSGRCRRRRRRGRSGGLG